MIRTAQQQCQRMRASDNCQQETNSALEGLEDEQELQHILSNIKIYRLESKSHERYVQELTNSLIKILRKREKLFLLFLKTIKDYREPCYNRDLCLSILDKLIFCSNFIPELLCDQQYSDRHSWRNLANALTALPDLVANCGLLHKLRRFQPISFYVFLLTKLITAIELSSSEVNIDISRWQKLVFIQVVGRVGMQSNFTQLVWNLVTRKALYEENEQTRSLLTEIISLPIESSLELPDASTSLEMLIEPLYLPIFFNLKPSNISGKQIKTLLGNKILSNDLLKYLICNKSILQAYYGHNLQRQKIILFNIFSYLSHVDDISFNREIDATTRSTSCSPPLSATNINSDSDGCLLIETLIEVAKSWSNRSKILLRSFEQNRYISIAFIVAFRYALEYTRQGLSQNAETIRKHLIDGTQQYLSRASYKDRNLAICLSEVLAPKLDQLVDELRAETDKTTDTCKGKKEKVETLKFDIELDDESLSIQKLLSGQLEVLFHDYNDDNYAVDSVCDDQQYDVGRDDCDGDDANVYKSPLTGTDSLRADATRGGKESSMQLKTRTAPVVEIEDIRVDRLDKKDSSLSAKTSSEIEDETHDTSSGANDDNMNDVDECSEVPIYLGDCISGLRDNSNPKIVRLCLMKAGELINEHLKPRPAPKAKPQLKPKAYRDDTIRDIALELAEVLLYLDDQFAIVGFDGLRTKALSLLCLAMPDIVGKYLLDEFNGSRRGTRHQLDILMVLVGCSQQLAPSETKHAVLYFYGIVHQLKVHPYSRVLSSIKSATNLESRRRIIMTPREIKPVILKLTTTTTTTSPKFSSVGGDNSSKYGASDTLIDNGEGGGSSSVDGVKTTSNSRDESANTIEHDREEDCNRLGRRNRAGADEDRDGDGNDDDDDNHGSRYSDSYLLSRIFFSISLIIKCLNQQPLVCKVSNDLLDILAAYRDHPDSGVHKSILACLAAIREFTPRVYFEEYLQDKTMYLFGSWLAEETELVVGIRGGRGIGGLINQ